MGLEFKGEKEKRECKVFDEYFEAHIDAHDAGGGAHGCVELRRFGLWTAGRLVCPLHLIGAM